MIFRPGQRIEFWSGDHGGCWKKGVVDHARNRKGGDGCYLAVVRIKVGKGVYVVRPAKKCRAVKGKKCLTAG